MQNPLLAITSLLFYDILFLAVVLLLIALLSRQKKAAYAVLNRNFSGYFSNPTGYVFLCLFVLLTSMAAFLPHEFSQQHGNAWPAQQMVSVYHAVLHPCHHNEHLG
ncbi:MAG: hypothetical protein U0905_05190 [Pirellulales bacterium]